MFLTLLLFYWFLPGALGQHEGQFVYYDGNSVIMQCPHSEANSTISFWWYNLNLDHGHLPENALLLHHSLHPDACKHKCALRRACYASLSYDGNCYALLTSAPELCHRWASIEHHHPDDDHHPEEEHPYRECSSQNPCHMSYKICRTPTCSLVNMAKLFCETNDADKAVATCDMSVDAGQCPVMRARRHLIRRKDRRRPHKHRILAPVVSGPVSQAHRNPFEIVEPHPIAHRPGSINIRVDSNGKSEASKNYRQPFYIRVATPKASPVVSAFIPPQAPPNRPLIGLAIPPQAHVRPALFHPLMHRPNPPLFIPRATPIIQGTNPFIKTLIPPKPAEVDSESDWRPIDDDNWALESTSDELESYKLDVTAGSASTVQGPIGSQGPIGPVGIPGPGRLGPIGTQRPRYPIRIPVPNRPVEIPRPPPGPLGIQVPQLAIARKIDGQPAHRAPFAGNPVVHRTPIKPPVAIPLGSSSVYADKPHPIVAPSPAASRPNATIVKPSVPPSPVKPDDEKPLPKNYFQEHHQPLIGKPHPKSLVHRASQASTTETPTSKPMAQQTATQPPVKPAGTTMSPRMIQHLADKVFGTGETNILDCPSGNRSRYLLHTSHADGVPTTFQLAPGNVDNEYECRKLCFNQKGCFLAVVTHGTRNCYTYSVAPPDSCSTLGKGFGAEKYLEQCTAENPCEWIMKMCRKPYCTLLQIAYLYCKNKLNKNMALSSCNEKIPFYVWN